MDPKQKKYDEWKGVLYHLLATDEFAGLFEDRYRDAKEMAQSIVDYIDKDDVYNEIGGEQRGREGAAGQQYQEMKNAKLLSVEELMMVPGMTEGVFQKLKEMVTVYGNSGKVYICRAKEPLVKALIIMYTDIHPQIEPLQDDNTELLDKTLEAVLNSCPDTVLLTQELDKVLGVVESTEDGGTSTASTTSLQGKKSPVEGGEPGSSITNFQDMLTDEANIFTIVAKGIVGESEVKLKTILDTSGGDPKQWQELYWRVE
jgi:hypothetical protein